MAYLGQYSSLMECIHCGKDRYSTRCIKCRKTGTLDCSCTTKDPVPNRILYYFPIEPRLKAIASSVYAPFLFYDEFRFRPKGLLNNWMFDVYDSDKWKFFTSQMGRDEKFIGISICWDGADIFQFSGKSMWATQICILNFPPPIRNKLWFGLHVTVLDTGSDAALYVLGQELEYLWRTGFVVNGQRYRVGVISAVFDGRGLEKAMKTHGANSLTGCNLCSFPGLRCGGATVYPGYRQYLHPTNPLRSGGVSGGLSEYPDTQFMQDEYKLEPEVFNYGRYEALAKEVACSGVGEIGGVKGLWELSECGYAEHIHITKDSMHAADNFIRDSVRAMIPSNANFVNRTTKPSVIADMQRLGLRYPFGGEVGSRPPWILSTEDLKKADSKMNHIFGCPQHFVVKKMFKKQSGGT
jgi:hypothetical protein